MDAIAVTIASRGEYVGIAPLGTAFTESQAAKVKPYLRDDPNRIVIATDPDSAGWQAAERAFWRLAALRGNPQHVALPEGIDPADILRTEGSAALAERLTDSNEFAEVLVDMVIDDRLAIGSDTFARLSIGRELARIIGALPPDRWLQHTQHVAGRLDLPLAIVQEEVFEAGTRWTDEPKACAMRALTARRPSAPPVLRPRPPEHLQLPAQAAPSVSPPPLHRPGLGVAR